jgi:hypothetical protein
VDVRRGFILAKRSQTRVGTFVVTITGSSGTLSNSTQVQLTIFKFKED